MQGFSACGNFLDSTERVSKCNYELAVAAYRRGDYSTAIALFADLGSYSDSAEQLAQVTEEYRAARYEQALFDYYDGKLADALAVFEELGDYKDSPSWVEKIRAEG